MENLRNVQFAHFFAEPFARLNHDVSLHTRVHVVLDVNSVLLGDFHEHTNVVLVIGVLLLVRMQEVLVLL